MIKIVIYTTKITRRILYSKLNNEIVLWDVETKIWKRTRRRLRQLLRDSLPTWKSAISSRDIKGRRRRNSYRFDVIYRMLFFIKKKKEKGKRKKGRSTKGGWTKLQAIRTYLPRIDTSNTVRGSRLLHLFQDVAEGVQKQKNLTNARYKYTGGSRNKDANFSNRIKKLFR